MENQQYGGIASAHTAGFPVQLYSEEIAAGQSAPLHRHRQLELLTVNSGIVRLRFAAGAAELTAGQGALINAGVMHSLESAAGGKCAYILFADEFIAPAGSDISDKYVKPLVDNSALAFVPFDGRFSWQSSVMESALRANALLAAISRGGAEPDAPCAELDVHRLICDIWAALYRQLGGTVRLTANANEHAVRRRIQRMTDFIHSAYHGTVTLERIAAAANISKSEAARCFQSCLGTSPVAYLQQYRVEMAQQLLQGGDMSVEVIAAECGFGSASYFCKTFQRHTGLTPGQFRKSCRAAEAGQKSLRRELPHGIGKVKA